jgi:hypothetical protein
VRLIYIQYNDKGDHDRAIAPVTTRMLEVASTSAYPGLYGRRTRIEAVITTDFINAANKQEYAMIVLG